MMTKKKKKTLMISSLIVILLIIVSSLIILYIKTDMFKSNQTLFLKYLGENTEIIKEIEKISENTEYENLLENSKYTENVEMEVNYTEDYGTTSENTNNSINDLKLTIEGQVDNVNKYNYKDIKLLKNDGQILELEYEQSNNEYGIRFSDLFKQYILVENNNLKELFEKFGYSEQDIGEIPNSIEMSQGDIANTIKLNDNEIEILKEKYINIINKDFSKGDFAKKSNQIISVNQKDIKANAYALKLTKEKLNNIYINILESLKDEEIILRKIDNIQDIINKNITSTSQTTNLREKFAKEIEYIIEAINRNNIGTEETSIIVYVNQGETIRTTIQGVDYQINLDSIKTEHETFMEINLNKNENKVQKISITKNDKKTNLNIESKENNIPIIISVEKDNHIEDKKCKKNINIKYEDETNKLESNIIINTNIVDNFENSIVFDNENSIRLNELNADELNAILNKVIEEVEMKLETVAQEIKIEDFQQMLINMNILNNAQILEGEGISDSEKNRFNSKFEILEGESIDSDNMLRIFEIIKDNITNSQTISNKELKIEISREDKNEELVKALEGFIKNNDNRKYNAKVEYDEETGLVKYVILTIVDE